MNKAEQLIIEKMIENIVETIAQENGISPMQAVHEFYGSVTHQMLKDEKLQLWQLSNKGLLDLWHNERTHGNPRLSVYLS
ncbi:hypothetical protein [Neisseria yangbaofengii]|uniref:hypothetical protein n=1 Tax=Neisseria yangbaofengii TaxID=2709396 RepID=UPI0013EBAA07|nr:hypothetical protein [Neisseria yangbaofengii]